EVIDIDGKRGTLGELPGNERLLHIREARVADSCTGVAAIGGRIVRIQADALEDGDYGYVIESKGGLGPDRAGKVGGADIDRDRTVRAAVRSEESGCNLDFEKPRIIGVREPLARVI